MDELTIGAKFGRYELLGELARGAMGTVYKARDEVLGRTVALKVMSTSIATSPEEEDEFRARFEREAQIAARLRHPHIVQVLDIGNDASHGVSYIALEFIDGETLRDRIDRERRMPIEDAVGTARAMLDALSFAHKAGVIHRDVKPSNVLVGKGGEVKLTDFGIARVAQSDLTRTGVHVGTPNFMAPEQVRGRTADARSDLFAVGISLYWMVTGKRPFGEDDPARVAYRTVNVLPVPPHEVFPGVPAALSKTILRALEKDPAKRFQSADEFTAALGPAAAPAQRPEPPAETIAVRLPEAAVPAFAGPAPPSWRTVILVNLAFLALVAIAVFALLAYQRSELLARPVAPSAPAPSTLAVKQAWDLGVDYYRAGQLDDAAAQFERVLALDPGNGDARQYLELVRKQQSSSATVSASPAPTAPESPEATEATGGTPPEATPTVAEATPSSVPTSTPSASPAATATPAPASTAASRDAQLGLVINHRAETGTLEAIVDGTSVGSIPLQGKKQGIGFGWRGSQRALLPVPSGRHTLTLRSSAMHDGEARNGEQKVAATFPRGGVVNCIVEVDKGGVLAVRLVAVGGDKPR